MIEFKPGDEAKAQDAIEHLVNRGRQRAMYQLMGTGIKISQAAQAITASQLSGPIKGAPRVRQVGDDEVHVGYSHRVRTRTRKVLAKALIVAKRAVLR